MKSFQYIKNRGSRRKKTFHVCLIWNIWEDGECLPWLLGMQLLQKDVLYVHKKGSGGQVGNLSLNLQGTETCVLTRCQSPSAALRPVLADSHPHLHTSTNAPWF